MLERNLLFTPKIIHRGAKNSKCTKEISYSLKVTERKLLFTQKIKRVAENSLSLKERSVKTVFIALSLPEPALLSTRTWSESSISAAAAAKNHKKNFIWCAPAGCWRWPEQSEGEGKGKISIAVADDVGSRRLLTWTQHRVVRNKNAGPLPLLLAAAAVRRNEPRMLVHAARPEVSCNGIFHQFILSSVPTEVDLSPNLKPETAVFLERPSLRFYHFPKRLVPRAGKLRWTLRGLIGEVTGLPPSRTAPTAARVRLRSSGHRRLRDDVIVFCHSPSPGTAARSSRNSNHADASRPVQARSCRQRRRRRRRRPARAKTGGGRTSCSCFTRALLPAAARVQVRRRRRRRRPAADDGEPATRRPPLTPRQRCRNRLLGRFSGFAYLLNTEGASLLVDRPEDGTVGPRKAQPNPKRYR